MLIFFVHFVYLVYDLVKLTLSLVDTHKSVTK